MMASDSAAATAWRVKAPAFFVAVNLSFPESKNIAHARAGRCKLDCVGVWFQLGRFGFGVVNDEIPGVYVGA
tara:strand:- start:1352 stop:1567 length:216 start_codon:yes stop_codon:yes gene_type:complete